jgi:type II secretory pathway pseudopilin PulG
VRARINPGRGTGGFTIVELLIVIAIIIMLMGILIVAINAATRTAQGANTRSLMSSIKQALVRFQGDFGYFPPVLGDRDPLVVDFPENHDLRRLFGPFGEDGEWGTSDDIVPELSLDVPNDNYRDNIQEWYSVTTLAEYLLGYGNHRQDGYGVVPGVPANFDWADETPPLGIRDPGRDGVWGAAIKGGTLESRMGGPDAYSTEVGPLNIDTGKVHGPYLDLKDERMLGAVTWDTAREELVVTFPGEGRYVAGDPKVIVDYWGNPIRYYRRLYAPGEPRSGYRMLDESLPQPTLSDVFLLRPFEVDPGGAVDNDWPDDDGDTTTTIALNSAEFALFSAGADRAYDEKYRYDAEEYNRDNIVELGP